MIGGIKKVKTIPGKEKEFEQLFNELKSCVTMDEPGNVYYDLYQDSEQGRYRVMERYIDKAALEAHEKSKHGAVYFPKIRALLEELHVEYLESID